MEQQAELSWALQVSKDGHWPVRNLARQGARDPLKPFLIHRVSPLQVTLPQKCPCYRWLCSIHHQWCQNPFVCPRRSLQFLSAAHELCFSHTSQRCCSRGWQDAGEGKRAVRAGKERKQGGLFCKGIPSTGELLPCRMGPGCNLESRQWAPEGPVLHSAAANVCKGLRTHNDQARITPYKNKSIQKRFFPKSNSTIFICCCRIRKVRFRSTPPNSPVTLGGMVPCLSHGL